MGRLLCLVVSVLSVLTFDVCGLQHLSSRLARLSAELGLCQSFQAFHSTYSDTGLLGIYFVTDKNNIEDMMHWSQNAWLVAISAVGDFKRHYFLHLIINTIDILSLRDVGCHNENVVGLSLIVCCC